MQMPLTYVILTNYDALDECVKCNVASAMCMIEPCEHLRIMQLVAPQKVVQKAHFTVRYHFSKFATLYYLGTAHRITLQAHPTIPFVTPDTLN
jgi:hypothetical protein